VGYRCSHYLDLPAPKAEAPQPRTCQTHYAGARYEDCDAADLSFALSGAIQAIHPKAEAPPKPCACGNPDDKVVFHRTDGPCHNYQTGQTAKPAPPAPKERISIRAVAEKLLAHIDKPAPPAPKCVKVPHAGTGYLHAEDDDGPYDVDGVLYCGRCHSWFVNGECTAARNLDQPYQAKPAPPPQYAEPDGAETVLCRCGHFMSVHPLTGDCFPKMACRCQSFRPAPPGSVPTKPAPPANVRDPPIDWTAANDWSERMAVDPSNNSARAYLALKAQNAALSADLEESNAAYRLASVLCHRKDEQNAALTVQVQAAERDSSASMELYRAAVARRDDAEAKVATLTAELERLEGIILLCGLPGWEGRLLVARKAVIAARAASEAGKA
jgi:hypothetical protein